MLNSESIILGDLGVRCSRIIDDDFPKCLSVIPDAPKKLYYIGDLSLLNEENNIAVVGARQADLYAKHITNSLISALASYRAVIVSGGAKGIDMTAHAAALENSLPTIIVLGTGILASPFSMNSFFIKKLREIKGSLIISEFEPFAVAQRWTFAYRNRLIAALSKSTVVIQASSKSGSLITANYARKYKKSLFAFSAHGLGGNYSGNHELLEQGKAKCLNSAEDLLLEHSPLSSRLAKDTLTKTERLPPTNDGLLVNLLELIGTGIYSFEHLKIKTNVNPTTLSKFLSLLEVKGLITRAVNGEYFRTG